MLTFAIADDAVTYAPVTQTFALGTLAGLGVLTWVVYHSPLPDERRQGARSDGLRCIVVSTTARSPGVGVRLPALQAIPDRRVRFC